MEKLGDREEEAKLKSQLVTDICFISSKFTSCPHRRRHPRKSAFIDWYLLLQVEEDAGFDVIRKQYRQLALQLHPDKNRHPQAEVAFKLISERGNVSDISVMMVLLMEGMYLTSASWIATAKQTDRNFPSMLELYNLRGSALEIPFFALIGYDQTAYACLSDKTRRRAFNNDRLKSYCYECHGRFKSKNHKWTNILDAEQLKNHHPAEKMRSKRVLESLKVRFLEEAKVIENCLRAHGTSNVEFPIFNPSDYSWNYPYQRARIFMNLNRDCWGLNDENNQMHDYRRGKCESPVYEIRSENQSVRTRPTTLKA